MVSTLEVVAPAKAEQDFGKTFTLKIGETLTIGSDDRRVVIKAIEGSKVKVKLVAPEHGKVKKKKPA